MKNEFLKEDKNPLLNPVDYYNFYGSFTQIFDGLKTAHAKSDNEICCINLKDMELNNINQTTFLLKGYLVDVLTENEYKIAVNSTISKFMLLTAVKFKGDITAAISYVSIYVMKSELPYIRVGTDYYKIIKKTDRWGAINIMLKPWKKDEIKQDHSKSILSYILKFDDFTILPNNKTFIPVKNNCYNLYSKFAHDTNQHDVTLNDIPVTIGLLNHIFGTQVQLGLKYMKLLYENPMQILPVLALVSTERETGKTTFLNWISMIFGENSVLISPGDLTHNFNSGYATKNIIMVDETVIEKSTSVEKLKSLATAKTISVSQKFVQQYSVPFFGKIIICTNKEKDFMRIDEEEIRFWVRKIKPITGQKNVNIEDDLFNEIPKVLKFLELMPSIDISNSRMVFTQEEIGTSQLQIIKDESKSGLHKELDMHIEDFFNNNSELKSLMVTAIDIKDKWYSHNNQYSIAYIRKVIKDEMKLKSLENQRYYPFGEISMSQRVGTPFEFLNRNYQYIENQIDEKSTPINF